jgi:hypothetical protein
LEDRVDRPSAIAAPSIRTSPGRRIEAVAIVITRVAVRVFAKYEVGLGDADFFGAHDLIDRWLPEHLVLTDALALGEGVLADGRLVGPGLQAGDRRDHPAHRVEPLGLDVRRRAVEVPACLEGHDELLKLGIACACRSR